MPPVGTEHLIAGAPNQLELSSSATACVASITMQPSAKADDKLAWRLKGSDPIPLTGNNPSDIGDWIYDITQVRTPFFQKYQPLILGIESYLTAAGNGVQQILVSGHSLGGGMVQMFIDALVKFGYQGTITGYTFGSIGGESDTVENATGRITNFIHVDDVANAICLGVGRTALFSGTGLYPVFDLISTTENIQDIVEAFVQAVKQGDGIGLGTGDLGLLVISLRPSVR